jgi:MFS transporter, YNFM family, putative membrane transport protein
MDPATSTATSTATADKRPSPAVAYYRPGEPGYLRLIVALFAAGVATFAALYSTQPLLGLLARDFALPASRAAWSVSVTTLLLGIGMLAAGPLSDRWGRTRMIKGSLVMTAVLGAGCAVAPSWPALLVFRGAQGLALAGVPAVALVYLREEVHASVHPRTTGMYVAGTAIGGMTGRLVAGGAADLAGWRWAIAAVAVLSGLCALVAIVALPASRHDTRSGAALPAAGDRRTGRHALGAAARAVRDRQLLCLYLIGFTSMGAFVAVYNVLGLRLTAPPYRLSVFAASLVFCVYPLGSASSAVAGRLAERLGRPVMVLTGGLFAVAGVAVSLASPLPVVILGVAMITVGFFAVHGIASGWAASAGQRRHSVSQASAFYLLAYYLGSSVFGALGTNLWESGRWPAVAVMASVLLLTAAATGGTQLLQTRRPGRPPAPMAGLAGAGRGLPAGLDLRELLVVVGAAERRAEPELLPGGRGHDDVPKSPTALVLAPHIGNAGHLGPRALVQAAEGPCAEAIRVQLGEGPENGDCEVESGERRDPHNDRGPRERRAVPRLDGQDRDQHADCEAQSGDKQKTSALRGA